MIARERPAAGKPLGALVLLHGRGADENDLFPLLDVLDPDRRLHGFTPRGPLSLPPGGAHWYVVPRVGYPDRDTFAASYAEAGEWLDALPPVALGHGTLDPVIPVEFGRAARDRLLAAGDDLLYREYPLPHTLEPGFVADVRDWLRVRVA